MVKMIKKKTILAIGAHPDDIEYYAGGTLLKMAKDNQIFYVVATDGGLNGDGKLRKAEQGRASSFMRVKKTIFLNYPDLGLEDRKKKLHRDLLKIILKLRPDLVFTFDPENQFAVQNDTHPDHRALAMIVLDLALIYSVLPTYIKKMGLKLKPLESKSQLWLFNPKRPNHFEDIASLWPKKLALLKIFKSQNLDFLANVKYAEGFKREMFNG